MKKRLRVESRNFVGVLFLETAEKGIGEVFQFGLLNICQFFSSKRQYILIPKKMTRVR